MADETTQTDESMNGADTESKRKDPIAESETDGTTVRFTFKGGTKVELDVADLSEEARLKYAIDGVRIGARLSFQKMNDPVAAARALQSKFDRMRNGVVGGARRRERHVDDLTQALANLTGKSVDFIEDTWYDRYFRDEKSGCTINESKDGTRRIFGKKEALDRLRLDPGIRPEIERLVKERTAKVGKAKTPPLDLASLAA